MNVTTLHGRTGTETTIIVPFVAGRLEPAVRGALRDAPCPVEYHLVSEDPEAYWRLIAGRWRAGESFGVVEQDIVVPRPALDEILACDQEWCAVPYPYLQGMYAGLGYVRYDEALLRRIPDALDQAGELVADGHTARHWCTLDAHLNYNVLPRAGARVHVHHDHPCTHIGVEDGPSHGCVPRARWET